MIGAMTAAWRSEGDWHDLADHQAGVITRRQLLECGWSEADVDVARRFAGWAMLGGGVYALHRGPLHPDARAWAVVLRCGPGAALAGASALALWGCEQGPTERWHVAVQADRHPRVPSTVCLHRVRSHEVRVHLGSGPPRQRVEAAVLDAVAECAGERRALGLVLGALGERLTTPDRLEADLRLRGRHSKRRLLQGILTDARTGAASCLEIEYQRRVQRPHHLPPVRINVPEQVGSRRVYRDLRYQGLVVELDGAAHHGHMTAVADRRRDNDLVVAGERTLRFGWTEVVDDPCQVAATVALALGGLHLARPCGPVCGLVRER